MTEVWKRVRREPAYAVSNEGNVRRVFPDARGKVPGPIKQWTDELGYKRVNIHPLIGKKRRCLVHRLVCEAFHGPPPFEKAEVAHGDGNPGNNRVGNLRWATRKENMADCLRHGTRACGPRHGRATKPHRTPRGERHGHAKLTAEQVREIRTAPNQVGVGRQLAAKFNVTPALICGIRKGRIWRHLP